MQEIFDFGLLALANRTLKFPEKSEHLSTSLLAFGSGNAFWRSSWQTNADYLHIYNGNLGSGHGHAALGHIDLVIDGQDVLVDLGRYTYVDGTERRYLKSPSAHNVMTVDHQAFSRPKIHGSMLMWRHHLAFMKLSDHTHNQWCSVILIAKIKRP
ncbi:heparinase II/III domain-containing protein [Lacticaseibacillus saniviri]|uniref:heparinase II/III domain-containing protein n=1 Tax=Lacticaseibacillus saniviri TaxID=931533 RepID=UPI000B33BEE9|nr:heparinase II/III family protein [Lacticaseibacillus saniviri]